MKRRKPWLIPVIAVGSIQLLSIIIVVVLIIGITDRKTDISYYEKYRQKTGEANKYLPSLEEIDSYNPNKKLFSYQEKTEFIFTSYGISLFVDYKEEAYQTIVNNYETDNSFLTDEDIERELKCEYCCFPVKEFDYKNYHFKIEAQYYLGSNVKSCKSFMFIGFDDENTNIAYLYFYDFDIDYTYEPKEGDTLKDRENAMKKMIKDYFYWRDL